MPKRLKDNLSSLYIGAANSMRPKTARHKIVAYVESYDDIAFWRNILGEYEDKTHYFEVMLPSKTSLSKGKKIALDNDLGPRLGENMIACVDSDYDYLIQGATRMSKFMLESPYVLQTYVYAIENYQCYAESLHEVCVSATLNDHQLIDFVNFMEIYSRIAYPLFIWHIYFYCINELGKLPVTELCMNLKVEHFNVYHPERCLGEIQWRVERKLRNLREKYPEAVEKVDTLKDNLKKLGVEPDNTYLFIQGHHIFENVAMRMLDPICTILRKERENEISSLAAHGMQYQNELSCYEDRQVSAYMALKKNTDFKNCPMFKKVNEDILNLLGLIKKQENKDSSKNTN
ncbi:MAG: DUF4435 domain-containing protein [Phocaeicola sp.]|uniref:DUF4435 domain-containing protein n=1 Tax=Phocaeicola TaxID=909656 RepID=UPI00234F706D|nr:DUF4435 domain-containing protein [Phocaeicola oris]MCE2617087.1 DUF4435 domain-containing protein [Phocaeicola oris]